MTIWGKGYISSNGDRFLFHNKIATDGTIEREIGLDEFPSPETLWEYISAFSH